MKKTIIATSFIAIFSTLALIVFIKLTSRNGNKDENFAEAKRGTFEIIVSNAGELIAENSVDIKGPDIVRNRYFRASAIKITDLVPEGTRVKKGDYIATLDRTNFNNTLKDEQDVLKTNLDDLQMKILDTAVVLSSLRDEIKNQYFEVEEAGITLAQSKYEPPSVQRLAAIELDKSQRMLAQQKKAYLLKKREALAETRSLKYIADNQLRKVNDLRDILAGFTITAPADGMVIYKKDRLGNKIQTGSMLNPWDPVVATLPDMSTMLSKVYISEIDVNKVKTEQPVRITIDAFPGRSFTGKVESIANIGEQLSNTDSKVFEVLVKIDGSNPMLRPSMTTSNKLITKVFSDVVYVPSECLQAGMDNVPFVYTKSGRKQIVIPGESNDKNVIIEKGLTAGTIVWITTPDNPARYKLAGNELRDEIKERELARKAGIETLGKERTLISRSDTITHHADRVERIPSASALPYRTN